MVHFIFATVYMSEKGRLLWLSCFNFHTFELPKSLHLSYTIITHPIQSLQQPPKTNSVTVKEDTACSSETYYSYLNEKGNLELNSEIYKTVSEIWEKVK